MSRHLFALLPLLAAAACSDDEHGDSAGEAPSVSFLAPTDGEALTSGEVQVSLLVEHFTLVSPEARSRHGDWVLDLLPGRAAWAHSDTEVPEGVVELRLDGAVVATLSETQHTLSGVAAGDHSLSAQLLYADGDPLDEPATAEVTFSVAQR